MRESGRNGRARIASFRLITPLKLAPKTLENPLEKLQEGRSFTLTKSGPDLTTGSLKKALRKP